MRCVYWLKEFERWGWVGIGSGSGCRIRMFGDGLFDFVDGNGLEQGGGGWG